MEPQAAKNRLNAGDRHFWWLVTYEMDPAFFVDFNPSEQYQQESADGVNAVELYLEHIWKDAYTSLDFKKGWILLDLGNESTEADAEKILKNYPMYKYYADTLKYTRVYSAKVAGLNFKIITGGIGKYIKDHL